MDTMIGVNLAKNVFQVHGASMSGQVQFRRKAEGSWLDRLARRKPRMLVAVALANKMARTIWAMLTKQQDDREPARALSAC